MPLEDRPVQIAIASLGSDAPPTAGATPIEMGGRGDVVELIAVHYSMNIVNTPVLLQYALALSSDPEHELAPPATIEAILVDTSVYAVLAQIKALTTSATGYATTMEFNTRIIPLHGIVRPRRQIFIMTYEGTVQPILARAELYYRPISVDKVTQDVINRRYGKYRRT